MSKIIFKEKSAQEKLCKYCGNKPTYDASDEYCSDKCEKKDSVWQFG